MYVHFRYLFIKCKIVKLCIEKLSNRKLLSFDEFGCTQKEYFFVDSFKVNFLK